MSEHTPEFLAQYRVKYGSSFSTAAPDYSKCAEEVVTYTGRWPSHSQCSRKNGYGPHGAWCKQHNPDAVKAKREDAFAKWQEESAAKDRELKFKSDCIDAVNQIAVGHNDPRGLCQSIIDRRDGK